MAEAAWRWLAVVTYGRSETIPAQIHTATIAVVPEAITQSVGRKSGPDGLGEGAIDPLPSSSSHSSCSKTHAHNTPSSQRHHLHTIDWGARNG